MPVFKPIKTRTFDTTKREDREAMGRLFCGHEVWNVFDTLPPSYSCAHCYIRGVELPDGRIVADEKEMKNE